MVAITEVEVDALTEANPETETAAPTTEVAAPRTGNGPQRALRKISTRCRTKSGCKRSSSSDCAEVVVQTTRANHVTLWAKNAILAEA